MNRKWCGTCYTYHCEESDTTRQLTRVWRALEKTLPENHSINLSGPNNIGHYNVSIYDKSQPPTKIKDGETDGFVTPSGGDIEIQYPLVNGFGASPALALRNTIQRYESLR